MDRETAKESLDEARWKLLRVAGNVNLALYVRGVGPAEIEAELTSVVNDLKAVLHEEDWVPKSIVAICVFILNQLDGYGDQPSISSTAVDGTVTRAAPTPGPVRGVEPYRHVADRWRRDLSELFGSVTISG